MNKKIVFFICLIVIILSAACVSAAEDVAQTNIGDTSNLDANGGILAISSSENEILGADEGTFTELQAEINNAQNELNLTKDYKWDDAFKDYAIKINNPITINGNGHTIDALNQNDLRIFEINNVNSGIILDNITFKNGNTASQGGAIYILSDLSDSKFTNLNFINNTAKFNGGAVRFYKTSENNLFENLIFIDNSAANNGGALYITGTSTSDTFKNVIFANNVAETADGGAINFHGEVDGATFDKVLFYNNRAEASVGGAVNFDQGIKNSIFNNTYFIDNAAKTGGAIGITRTISSLTFENTQFINNTALVDDGGAINIGPWGHSDLANTIFKNVLFENNSANNNGGALFVTANTLSNTFENVNFTNNEAKTADGGAITFGANSGYTTEKNTFKNVNFINNTANENGGALYVTGESTSNTFENVEFINNTAKNWDGGAINFYKLVNDTTFEEVLFYKNSAPSSGGGAVNCDYGMENTRFNNTLFVENSALYTSAIAISGETSSNTIESSIFYNNTANNYLICIMDSGSDNAIHDSIFLNNGDYNYYAITTVSGNIELTDNWFGNNATNYDENPEVYYDLDNWLFLNATANPAAITLNQTSTVTFKFSSFKDDSGVEEYDGPVLVFLELNSTLGTLNRDVALTDDEIVYTPSESGNGSVTGKFLNVYYTVNIENDKIPTEISVENSTLDMLVLDNVPAGANLTPADAGYLSYNSSNSSVAVAIYGRIIAVGEGEATITVSFNGTTRYAAAENKTIEVTVSKRPTEIILLNDTLNVTVLEFIPEVATLDPAEAGNLSYTSSNSSIVQIYDDSIIPIGEGSAIITVSFDGDEIYAAAENRTITVNVRLNDASVSVDNDTLDLFVEDTYAINATTVPDFLVHVIDYTSSNEDVATVDETGTVTAVAEGTAIITVEVGDGKIFAKNSTTVTVTVSRIPTEITVANTTLDMIPLDFSAIDATLTPDVGSLTYNTTDSSVANVLFGYIIAVGEGKANITVSFEGDNIYAPAEKIIEVNVAKIPTEITVENTTIEMNPFDVTPAGAKLTPGLDLTLTYTSSNSSVATVILGEIIAVGEGEATITVSFDGTIRYAAAENKTIDVTVTKIPTEITVENTEIEMAPLDIAPAGANLTNASNLYLDYVSSNSSVAVVILGEIVAVGEGEATITVSFNGTTRYAAAENKTIDVIVTKIPTEITVENTTIEMAPLDIAPTGADLTNASNLLLTYTSSNSSVAVVILGEIVAVGEGEATIT
ncbi:Ig-like domain-containing protein, partial [Methanobrevibacter sp.]|uniref:Ig-like domain-containing protein n=1 Tax=Methanobrevibacter sp. TaxID=66852 RepID=UPI00388EEEBD